MLKWDCYILCNSWSRDLFRAEEGDSMKRVLLSTLAGALIGFLYYRFIGCYSGTCSITSDPFASTFYFAIIGLLFGFIIKKETKEETRKA